MTEEALVGEIDVEDVPSALSRNPFLSLAREELLNFPFFVGLAGERRRVDIKVLLMVLHEGLAENLQERRTTTGRERNRLRRG